jgi:hypothetical protein
LGAAVHAGVHTFGARRYVPSATLSACKLLELFIERVGPREVRSMKAEGSPGAIPARTRRRDAEVPKLRSSASLCRPLSVVQVVTDRAELPSIRYECKPFDDERVTVTNGPLISPAHARRR